MVRLLGYPVTRLQYTMYLSSDLLVQAVNQLGGDVRSLSPLINLTYLDCSINHCKAHQQARCRSLSCLFIFDLISYMHVCAVTGPISTWLPSMTNLQLLDLVRQVQYLSDSCSGSLHGSYAAPSC